MDIVELAKIAQKKEIEALRGQSGLVSQRVVNGKDTKKEWPDPPDNVIYRGIMGEFIDLISPETEADPVALIANFLTAFGSVVGSKSHFRVEGDRHSVRLFSVLVGQTSKSRKGTSWGHIKNIFSDIDPLWGKNIQSGLSSGEGLIWAVRDGTSRSTPKKDGDTVIGHDEEVVDEGVRDKRMLIIEGEFAAILKVLQREGSILSAVVRSAWDSGDLQVLTKNSPIRATAAHVSIIGHITKDELLRYLTVTESGNGFGNRFLWFCVKRSKVLPFGGKIDEAKLSDLKKRLREVIDFSEEIDQIQWSEETRPLWEFIYPFLSEGKPGLVGSMTARSEAYVARLASEYALLDKSSIIEPEHLMAALGVWDYAEESAQCIFQDSLGDEVADRILLMLSENVEGLTRTDISNNFGRHKSSEELARALDSLLRLRKIKRDFLVDEGRKTELFTSLNSLNSHSERNLDKLKEYMGTPHK